MRLSGLSGALPLATLFIPFTDAAAESANAERLGPFIPIIAISVLSLMGLIFVVAFVALLFLKDTKENQSAIKAANSVVKTFGGFFTGLATALMR